MYQFKFGSEVSSVLGVFVDIDFAGCQHTRRSTSSGVAMLGQCFIKHWSKTQTIVSLSSGEAELHGIAYGASQALGLQALLKDIGWDVRIRLHSDATAAIGMCKRKASMKKAMVKVGTARMDGRPACAPAAMGFQS